jgi:hypothetical protein
MAILVKVARKGMVFLAAVCLQSLGEGVDISKEPLSARKATRAMLKKEKKKGR